MTKVFEERMKDFVKAGYELSKMWDGLTQEESEAITLKSYPFTEDFTKVVFDLGEWAQEALEGLEKIRLEKEFEEIKFAMAVSSKYTEDGWFVSVKLQNGKLYLEEEIAGYIYDIDIREFEGNFIQVDKSLYELAMKLNSYGDYDSVCKLQDLAKQIKDFDLNV